jgi:hypothetical protein
MTELHAFLILAHQMEMRNQLHAASVYLRVKSPRYPLDIRLGGPQSRSGRCRKEEISVSGGNQTPIPRSSRFITILSELSPAQENI